MKHDLPQPRRKTIRLEDYDYSQAGAYFFTICTRNRTCLFGRVADAEMVLNDAGQSVWNTWNDLPNHIPHMVLDAFVVMPNHVHGIIGIVDNPVGAGSKPARLPTYWSGA